MKITKARNAKYIDSDKKRIDCEVLHEEYGWIPYTSCPDDPSKDAQSIREVILSLGRRIKDYEPPDLSFSKKLVQESLASYRHTKETSSISIGGVRVATTLDSQNRITSIISIAELSGIFEVDFKAESGWVKLSLDEVKYIASCIGKYVQECFSTERLHSENIDSLQTTEEVMSYDFAPAWPEGIYESE